MKTITLALLPLLAAMAQPALASEPQSTETQSETAPSTATPTAAVPSEVGNAITAVARGLKPTGEAVLRADLELIKTAAHSALGSDTKDEDVALDSAAYAAELRSLIAFMASKSANTDLNSTQAEILRQLTKTYLDRGKTLDALEINWLKTPAMLMTNEEARLAGYPCDGANNASEVTKKMRDAANDIATKRNSQTTVTKRHHSTVVIAHSDHGAKADDCDDCPDCADGTCTEASHTKTAQKDFDCVDCPDSANV
jgi:hypothetical protein